jgi:hypothetical protein
LSENSKKYFNTLIVVNTTFVTIWLKSKIRIAKINTENINEMIYNTIKWCRNLSETTAEVIGKASVFRIRGK